MTEEKIDLAGGTGEDLLHLGKILDKGGDKALELTEKVLHIRNRLGQKMGLVANQAQKQYHANAGRRNIVLKARPAMRTLIEPISATKVTSWPRCTALAATRY